MKKIAVVLSGCGYLDGAEINEAVLTLLAIDQQDASYQCFAPDIPQMHVVDHTTGEPVEGETRNCLTEAARIARGDIKPLDELDVADFDALIFPGGFGAAKNLCDFAVKGAEMTVLSSVEAVIKAFHNAQKPIGFICIAPAILAKVFGEGSQYTIGNDVETAKILESMGGTHVNCDVKDCVIDQNNKLVSTPAYMLATRISESAAGISKLVSGVLSLTA